MSSSILPGIVTDVGAVAGAIQEGEELAGKIVDATKSAQDRKAGADEATAKGQADALAALEKDKQVEDAMEDTTGGPAAQWADGVRDRFNRPD